MRWMKELFEAVFLAGLYEDFKRKADYRNEVFTVSRGKFVHDLNVRLDMQLAHQSNGVPIPPKIKIAYS